MQVVLAMRFFVSLLLLIDGVSLPKTLHIFGDSHGSFCFREGHYLQRLETFDLPVTINKKSLNFPFIIHWLGPITMHRVGRDGLEFLNVKSYGVRENDIVVFVFGEIDVRCHIGKQRDLKKRTLDEILDTLVEQYMSAVKANQQTFENITCVITNVIPPIDGANRNDPNYPFYGTLSERVMITRLLNQKLKFACAQKDFLFLDFYDLFTNQDGSLSEKYSDTRVHIDYIYNKLIKKKLFELIAPTLTS